MNRALRILPGVLTLLLSCEGPFRPDLPPPPPPPPVPAPRLIVRLDTPHADDGAILFEIRGPLMGAARVADTTYWMTGERVDSTMSRFLVAGDLSGGALIELEILDSLASSPYTATLMSVANRDDGVRPSLDGYRLTITRD